MEENQRKSFNSNAKIIMEKSEQFLYRIQPTRPAMLSDGAAPDEERIVAEHFAYLKELTEAGIVIHAGRTLNTDESSFGIVIFRATSEEEARKVMENDPAVQQAMMRAQLFPYRIALSEPHQETG
jgi:uncharacterized protein YciI